MERRQPCQSNVSQVNVDGGATPGEGQDEVLLDIDKVLSVAPGAKTIVYDAPFSGPGRQLSDRSRR